MTERSYYLAVDIGASSGRHILGYISNGKLTTEEIYRFENNARMKDEHLCWDADALFLHVMQGLTECAKRGVHPVSVGIDTWGVDFALLDAKGNRVGDIVAYRDARTEGMDTILEQTMPFAELYKISGIAKQPFNTIYQLMAVLKENPEYRSTVDDFLLMPEYLSFRLTGRKAHEETNLSTGALLDARTRTWAWDAIRAASLPDKWFQTPIVKAGTKLGTLLPEHAATLGFDTTVILPATHDTGSAFMAVPARDEQAVFLSSGTWSLLGTELTAPQTSAESKRLGFSNEMGYGGTTRFLKNIMGMWMMQCIRKEIDAGISYDEIARLADESTYSCCVDATANRFLAPASMKDEVCAALREQGSPAPADHKDLFRAVLLSLAICYRDSIREIETLSGKQFTSINIVGGGSRNRTLNRLTAEATGLPVFAGPTEGTALGNIVAQMIASGELNNLAAARRLIAESFEIQEYQ
ncbi:MAG TPA: rhamnulokinase family protein [Candidatus Limiplasma sp.]|nr:rhamnulokinase family protein [Candidatus Limiplasma sp.]